MFPTIKGALRNHEQRIEDMDAMGMDIQGLSTFVSEYGYWAPPNVAAEAARIQNDHLAQAVADMPDRFALFGATVPLQDVDRAIAEMDRAVDELGFKGLQIGGNVNGNNLDEPRFRPFWQAVAAKGIPVIIHPDGYQESDRFTQYFMTNCIGNPLETMVADQFGTNVPPEALFERNVSVRDDAAASAVPLLLLAADQDAVFPPVRHADQVFAHYEEHNPGRGAVERVPGGHDDVPRLLGYEVYVERVRTFVDGL